METFGLDSPMLCFFDCLVGKLDPGQAWKNNRAKFPQTHGPLSWHRVSSLACLTKDRLHHITRVESWLPECERVGDIKATLSGGAVKQGHGAVSFPHCGIILWSRFSGTHLCHVPRGRLLHILICKCSLLPTHHKSVWALSSAHIGTMGLIVMFNFTRDWNSYLLPFRTNPFTLLGVYSERKQS